MSGEKQDRLQRLGEAVFVFLEFQQGGGGDVEAFLREHEDLRDLLAPMFEENRLEADVVELAVQSALDAGEVLDDFRLVREIGRGGMGIVYEAEQLSLKRRVALKVLPRSLGISPVTIERLRREASAAAKLNHPGILPIYSVGEADGNHFFAMELVDGPSLQEVLARARASRADGEHEQGLGIVEGASRVTEVMDVIAQVAEGLAEAHANGVIHRDVKPHNILIDRHADGRRCVRIVDFGLAKDLDQVTVSRSGDVAGTPQYMSPEQVAGLGHVDARSDVFSLGVMMYECLALHTPFAGETTHRVMYQVVHKDAKPLRAVEPGIPYDVEVICAKAMEKSPRLRYASAAELAADLRRFLDHQPILAQPPGPWRRLKKLVRRHPLAAVTLAMAIVLVVVGTGGYLTHLRITNAALSGEKEETRRQRDRAMSHLREAQSVIDVLLAHVEDLAVLPGFEKSHHEMAEKIVSHLDKLMANPWGDDTASSITRVPTEQQIDLLLQATRARMRLARAYLWQDEHSTALQQVDAADRALNTVLSRYPQHRKARCYTGRNAIARGVILGSRGATDQAVEQYEKARQLFGDLVAATTSADDGHDELLGEVEATVYLSRLWSMFGTLEQMQRGVSLLRDAERKLESVAGLVDARIRDRLLQQALCGRALLLQRIGRRDAAMKAANRAVERGRRRVESYAQRPRARRDLAIALRTRAELCHSLRKPEPAIRDLEESCGILRQLAAEFPGTSSYKIQLSSAVLGLASRRAESGKNTEARRLVGEARAVLGTIPNDTDRNLRRQLGHCRRSEGLLHLVAGILPDARRELLAAVELQKALVAERPGTPTFRHDLGHTLHYLAICARQCRREKESLAAIRQAIEHQAEAVRLNPESTRYRRWLTKHQGCHAEIVLWTGDHAAAFAALQRFVEDAWDDGYATLSAATNMGNCMHHAADDTAIRSEDLTPVLDRYAKASIAALRRAVELGYRGSRHLRTASCFELLRPRREFEELLTEIDRLRRAKGK